MQTRRKFLASSAVTAAAFAVPGIAKKSFASSTPNAATYGAAVAAHSIATVNAVVTGPQYTDWVNAQSTVSACYTEWVNNGRDAGVAAAVSNVAASEITSANVNKPFMLSQLQLYNPSFTESDLDTILTYIDSNATLIPGVLSNLKSIGMSYYINEAGIQAGKLAAALKAGKIDNAPLRARLVEKGRGDMLPPGGPPGAGGGGYGCATDGLLLLAAGTAFGVLTFMTAGTDLLVGAAWAGIATWGGIGTGVWGAGHFMACGL